MILVIEDSKMDVLKRNLSPSNQSPLLDLIMLFDIQKTPPITEDIEIRKICFNLIFRINNIQWKKQVNIMMKDMYENHNEIPNDTPKNTVFKYFLPDVKKS